MIIVTGAAGFIGSVMVGKLNNKGFTDIIAVDDFSKPHKEQNLANKLIFAKTGIQNPLKQLVKAESAADNVVEQILLEDFRKLDSKAQIEVIRFVRQKEIETLDSASKNAEITEQQRK